MAATARGRKSTKPSQQNSKTGSGTGNKANESNAKQLVPGLIVTAGADVIRSKQLAEQGLATLELLCPRQLATAACHCDAQFGRLIAKDMHVASGWLGSIAAEAWRVARGKISFLRGMARALIRIIGRKLGALAGKWAAYCLGGSLVPGVKLIVVTAIGVGAGCLLATIAVSTLLN